jgi:hypothetical protein
MSTLPTKTPWKNLPHTALLIQSYAKNVAGNSTLFLADRDHGRYVTSPPPSIVTCLDLPRWMPVQMILNNGFDATLKKYLFTVWPDRPRT